MTQNCAVAFKPTIEPLTRDQPGHDQVSYSFINIRKHKLDSLKHTPGINGIPEHPLVQQISSSFDNFWVADLCKNKRLTLPKAPGGRIQTPDLGSDAAPRHSPLF